MTTKENWNHDWDKVVKPDATPLKEAEGGQIYKLDLKQYFKKMG